MYIHMMFLYPSNSTQLLRCSGMTRWGSDTIPSLHRVLHTAVAVEGAEGASPEIFWPRRTGMGHMIWFIFILYIIYIVNKNWENHHVVKV